LLPGYDIHVAKCREIFEQREAQKPPKERRSVPRDPYQLTGSKGFRSLEEENEIINQAWKSNLSQCQNCGRTFLPEKLVIHQRSCTAINPAKSISNFTRSNPTESCRDSSSSLKSTRMTTEFRGDSNRAGNGFVDDHDDDIYPMNGSQSKGRKGGLDPYRDTPEYGLLIKCRDCGRNFNPDSYEKHSRICRKVFRSKRKMYDSAKHRAEGTELAAYYDGRRSGGTRASSAMMSAAARSGNSRVGVSSTGVGSSRNRPRASSVSTWKQQSSAFRDAIRQAKQVSLAEKRSKETGIPLHVLLPANTGSGGRGGGFGESVIDPSYIQCQFCGRSFNQKAAERHIPKCQFIVNKPSRLSGHSGAPSYSTNSVAGLGGTNSSSARRMSSGSRGFGESTRESAYNNSVISRWTERSNDGAYTSNEQQMMSSKTHKTNDPVRFSNGNNGNSSGRPSGGFGSRGSRGGY
jgi:hypothetical protein